MLLCLSLLVPLASCKQPAREPVILRYPHGWRFEPDEVSKRAALTQQFTQQTGIQIREMPQPEAAFDQLDLFHKLLKPGSSGVDLLGIDSILSAILEPDLEDLAPYSAQEISSIDSELLPIYTVNGRLVAIPHQMNVAALEYRSDLLRKYGYQHPPRTWDELERMARRIQSGERAEGNTDFWGYVWQGAIGEALTCNALEWQASEGGGRIIESDRTISVNNPASIRAWERAHRWIGSISPPAVTAYHELDSMNVFGSGKAAFNRVWLGTTITRDKQSPVFWRNQNPIVDTGFTNMPGGRAGSAGTLGGSALAVSRHSDHRNEAIEIVRFLVRAQIQSNHSRESDPHAQFELSYPVSSSPPNDDSGRLIDRGMDLVLRPSIETGARYQQVSAAYAAAISEVLSGKKKAPEAAADLEKQLMQITGFRSGPPKTGN
jgi:trehalose/maltose transport system substrate-binding protein